VLTFQIRRPPVRSRAEELLRLSEALAPDGSVDRAPHQQIILALAFGELKG